MFKSILRMWPFLAPYKGSIVIALILGVIMALMAPIIPILIKIMFQALEQKQVLPEDVPEFIRTLSYWPSIKPYLNNHFYIIKGIVVALPIYFFIYGVARYFHFYLVRYIAEVMANDVRYKAMEHLLFLNPKFFQGANKGSGGMLSRTMNDTMIVQQSMQFYSDLIREPLVVIVLAVYLFILNWRLTLFCLIFLPIFTTLIKKITSSLKVLVNDGQGALDDLTSDLKEGLDGMRVIQSYNLEDAMRAKYKERITYYNSVRKKVVKRMEIASPLSEFLTSLFLAAIVAWVAQRIFIGKDTTGGFLAFLVAAGALNAPLKKIQQAIVRLPGVAVSIDRLLEIIDSKDVVTQLRNPVEFNQNWSEIEFKNVSFSYGDEKVLDNVCLKVQRGEVIALVGESGSGKSTLVNLLERFFDPDEGEITIDGISISHFPLRDLRENIALVNQDVFLFNDTLDSNIRAGNTEKTTEVVVQAAEKANAMSFIKNLPQQLETKAGERGANFSGGEKQRLSIARAIFKDAPILILDEATSALDSVSEVEVQKGIQSLMEGRTAFVIAHRLSTISKADRIVVMNKGQIVEEGNHQGLIDKQGLYAKYYNLQFR